jgi:hypothetical protein
VSLDVKSPLRTQIDKSAIPRWIGAQRVNELKYTLRLFAMQWTRWITGDGLTGSDVTRDHATRADNRIITYRDARQQNSASTDPNVAANRNRPTALQTCKARLAVPWVVCGIDVYGWANLRTIANANGHHIEKNAVEIQEDISAQI